MGWKDWSYWAKGGVLGIIISLLGSLLAFIIDYFELYNYLNLNFLEKIISVNILGSIGQLIPNDWPISILMILFFIIGFGGRILSYFIIGSIIGWIYGKIKSKR